MPKVLSKNRCSKNNPSAWVYSVFCAKVRYLVFVKCVISHDNGVGVMSKKKVVTKKAEVLKVLPVAEGSRVRLADRFANENDLKKFMQLLRERQNATQVARELGLNPVSVCQFCKRENIKLKPQGRPAMFDFDRKAMKAKVVKAHKERGGLAKLSRETGISYNALYALVG